MVGNTVANSKIGIALIGTDNDVIYQNNFINNKLQVGVGPEPMWSGGNEICYSICQWGEGRKRQLLE